MNKSPNSQQLKQLPSYKYLSIITTIVAVASLVAGFLLTGYLTFSIGNTTVTKVAYASALSTLIMLSVANIIIAMGVGLRKAIGSVIIAFLLGILAIIICWSMNEGTDLTLYNYTDFQATFWLMGSLVLVAPIMTFSVYWAIKNDSKSKVLSMTILLIVSFAALLCITIPVDLSARNAHSAFSQEQAKNIQEAKEEDAEYEALEKRQAAARIPLYTAAKSTVRELSKITLYGGVIPSEVTPPAGYIIVEYKVSEVKRRVDFCIHPLDVPHYYLGVIVDPTVKEGAMYWPSFPGESCYYDYQNYIQL